MTVDCNQPPEEVLRAYLDCAGTASCFPLGQGNINDTWLAATGEYRFVLQRINSRIFPHPPHVISNFQKVTQHLNTRSREENISYLCPKLIATWDGAPGFQDSRGDWWRAQSYIDHENPSQSGMSAETASELGRVLATYHYLVGDLDPGGLNDALPGFHVLRRYLQEYDIVMEHSVPTSDPVTSECVALVAACRPLAGRLAEAQAGGELQARVIHGDPKLDNVIFTGEGRAAGLFDLDTVGSGLLHHDLGDCLRSVCNRRGELAVPEKIHFDAEMYEAFLKGYREGSPARLGTAEISYIYDAVLTITFELGLRFLTDHLQGDVYFKVRSRGENLQKSRCQFALVKSIVDQEAVLRKLAESMFS